MRISIDTNTRKLVVDDERGHRELDLYCRDAFESLSRVWLKVGWALKYTYGFAWMGRPIIQLPEDMVRIQEAIYAVKPTVVVETGVAHGGSLIFYASLLKAMGTGGRVIGVDIEIRAHNRKAIEAHEMAPMITLVEGSSTAPETIGRVRSLLNPDDRVLVLLDSNHTRAHVAAELELYGPLVSTGSYIVATDGIMEEVHDAPRGQPAWAQDNPKAAAASFAARHPEFALEEPPTPFNEGTIDFRVTHWPGAWLRRVS